MSKLPYIKFYIGDYIKDSRRLTLEEKGAWTEALWAMHADGQKGTIEGSWEDISLTIGANGPERCQQVFQRIAEKKVCDLEVLEECNGVGCQIVRITNRRMATEYEVSAKRSTSGKAGAEASQKSKASAIELMEEKKQDFIARANEHSTEFGPEIINIFLSYWLEPNKSKTKYRFEKEAYFDFRKRLQTFQRNNRNYNEKGSQKSFGNTAGLTKDKYDSTPSKPI